MSAREAIIARLREQLRAADRTRLPGRRGVAALGVPAIDAALPWRGLARGGVHELLGGDGDAARFGFAAALLGRLPVGGGRILWCRGGHATREIGRPYGPGLAGFGLAPEGRLFFETRRAEEALWAIEEGLRCRRLAAVVGEGVARRPRREPAAATRRRSGRHAGPAAAGASEGRDDGGIHAMAASTVGRVRPRRRVWERHVGVSRCNAAAVAARENGWWSSTMRRFASLWLPRWPTDRWRRNRPVEGPLALIAAAQGGLRLTAVDGAAARKAWRRA